MASNGFEKAVQQLKTLVNINQKTTIEARKKAADYFVKVLRPQLLRSSIDKKHMADALTVVIEGDKVMVIFEDYGWYWYLKEHGHKKSNGKGRVRGTQTIRRTIDVEKSKLEKMMKEDILKKL